MPAKFTQVAVSSPSDDVEDSIVALDSDGVVWRFNWEEDQWECLPATRGDVINPEKT